MIEIQNVNYSYKEVIALKDITTTIKEGESIALIGPNGSGKSTFLKLINGIIHGNSGNYLFQQEKITEKKLQDPQFSKVFHKKIGFVFQNPDAQLFCSNVYEEIAFGPLQMGMSSVEVEKRVLDCLHLLGIEKLRNRTPYHLSGGEKKKVAIASVLALNPEVLVLDEPMNGIDPKGKEFLRELLLKLHSSGKTLLCSTHDFEYIEGVFHRCIVFSEEHRICRDDSYETIIKDSRFLKENNIK